MLLKNLPYEKREFILKCLDELRDIAVREREVTRRMSKKLTNRIKFIDDVMRSRQTLENLSEIMLKYAVERVEGGERHVS